MPFSALSVPGDVDLDSGPTVPPSRFRNRSDPPAGHWVDAVAPKHWETRPEVVFNSRETLARIRKAISGLPERQRIVVELRDVEGFTSAEVCSLLDITPGNQRILLHRGRVSVRQVLEDHGDGVVDA